MTRGRILALVGLPVLAATGLAIWRGSPTPDAPTPTPSAFAPRATPDPGTPPPPAPESPARSDPDPQALAPVDPQELSVRRDLGTGESEALLASLPTEIDYPLEDVYRDQVWSDVPYRLVAAHGGQQAGGGEGARRLFIAVVEPDLTDAALARLVRDIRARHREAEVLRIRVYDSEAAATRPSWTDGGAARREHLVADLYRDTQREVFRMRGVELDP